MRWFLFVKPPFERPEPYFRAPLCARRQMMGTDDSLSFEPNPGMAPLSLSASTIISHKPVGIRRLKRR